MNSKNILAGVVATAALAILNPISVSAGIGEVKEVVPHKCSTTVKSADATLEVTALTDDIFRVTTLPVNSNLKYSRSQSAILESQCPKTRVNSDSRTITLSTATTTVSIDRHSGSVSFINADGTPIISENGGVDNAKAMRSVSFHNPGGNFYGAGERGHKLRLNGDTLVMYNRQNYGYTEGDPRISQMNITIPYIASSDGYGILFDDYNAAKLILGEKEIVYLSDSPKPVSYYFINGHGTLAGTTEGYTLLTGRQELPPFWSLGYITSKYGYHTQAETLGVIDTLKTRGYPVDGIVLDLYWYGKEQDMGRFEWNKEQWPDHRKMLAELREKGVKLITISQPYINKIGAIDNYNMLSKAGMLTKDAQGNTHDVTTWVGDAGMLDVSNPDTRRWLWSRYKELTEDGVEGLWGDLGEPEVHPLTIMHANGETAGQYHNVYCNEWSRIIYEGFKKDFPDKRLMLLMRGGTAGLQRYSVFPWSTDVSRSWGGFQPQVKIMLNSGLSGLGYMSSDLGGFAVDPEHPIDPELYTRWVQAGVFTPTFRTHAQQKPEPYNYPQQEKILKRFVKMRYEWLPYNYTLAYENATTGAPLARPLNFRNSRDDKYANVDNEYMRGDEILVCPVMKPGVRTQKVLFPEGSWVNWNNPTQKYKGGSTAVVKASIDILPMFVKAGAFVPLYTQPIENTDQYDPTFLTVKYFPSAETTSYTLFDDNRKSPSSISDGAYQLTTFTGQSDKEGTEIRLQADGNGYEGMPKTRLIRFEIVGLAKAPTTVTYSENDSDVAAHSETIPRRKTAKAMSENGWHYDAATRTLVCLFSWNYDSAILKIN